MPGLSVFENGFETNNAVEGSHTLDVMPQPYADLKVTSVVTDPTATSGETLAVSWTVINEGIGVTSSDNWVDRVELVSASGTVAASAYYNHLGNLAVGATYSRTVDFVVPNGISGPYTARVYTGAQSARLNSCSATTTRAHPIRRRLHLRPRPIWWCRKS